MLPENVDFSACESLAEAEALAEKLFTVVDGAVAGMSAGLGVGLGFTPGGTTALVEIMRAAIGYSRGTVFEELATRQWPASEAEAR